MDNLDGKQLSDLKQWRCSNNDEHVLGVKIIGKEKLLVDGRSIHYSTTQLIIFRQAINLNLEVPEEIEVSGVCDGRILHFGWKCSICGAVTKWQPSKDFVQFLARTYLAE